jgi:hypothetical protein
MASTTTNTVAFLEMMEDALAGHRTSVYFYEDAVEAVDLKNLKDDAMYQFNWAVAFWDRDVEIWVDDNGVEHEFFDGNPGEVVLKYTNTLKEAEEEMYYIEDKDPNTRHYIVENPSVWGRELNFYKNISETYKDLEIRELKKCS